MKHEATQEDVDEAYTQWADTTEAIRAQMFDIAENYIGRTVIVEVVSEDYHVFLGREVWQWLVGAVAFMAAAGTLVLWRKRRKSWKKEQENEG